MNKFFLLPLLSACLLAQNSAVKRGPPAEPAVEFTTTSNASQVKVGFVAGYQFTVQAPLLLTSLGAVLQGGSSHPVFGALPVSMPVGLWDAAQHLLVSAIVSVSDPVIGHFNYKEVAGTLLLPGVSYTVAGLVAPGSSVLSAVPAMVSGSSIVYGGPRSIASGSLVFPPGDGIALRGGYFGASFTYSGSVNPVARPGRDRKVNPGVVVNLDGSDSFSASGGLLTWKWTLTSIPSGSTVTLSDSASAAPSFVPDRAGVYVAQLIVADGSAYSRPCTVSIEVAASGAGAGLRQAFERAIYALKTSGNGTWRGDNRAQRMTLEFDSSAAHLKSSAGSIHFHLTGYGYGTRLGKPAPARLTAMENRLEYRRGNLTEWYVNGSHGLEQGFSFAHRPSGPSLNNPLVIALGVTGDLALQQKNGAVLLASGKGVVLRYGGLTARDAGGHTLPSRLETQGREIRLVVEDRAARYPLVVDPTWSQQELTASNGASDDNFGTSVAIDGATAVIGAPGDGMSTPGAAYVFVQSGGTWSRQAELTSLDGVAGDDFGQGVAVSGGTAVIGAPGQNEGQGSAYVFVQTGSSWSQQMKLTSTDGLSNDNFGYSVAVSGGTAVVGAPDHDIGSGNQSGSAYVFVQSGSTWSQQMELTPADGLSNDLFGQSVGASGGTALIAAPQHMVGGNTYQGAAYVFVQSGDTWTLQAELTADDGAASDYFAYFVSLSGGTAVVGAFNKSGSQGAAYVFVQMGSTWSQQQELTASDGGGGDYFGYGVGVSGGTAVIGAFGRNDYQGVAYVFVQSGSTWTQQQELVASDGMALDQFGRSGVAVSGQTALIGAFGHTVGENADQGASYIFAPPASLSISATHSSPLFQAGPGTIVLTVANAGGPTLDTDTVSDTIDPAFTINSASAGCSIGGQVVTCALAPGEFATSTVFRVYVTASPTASASVSNTATLVDGRDNDSVTTAFSGDTIGVSAEAPQVDSHFAQITLSGSTDNDGNGGFCADGDHTLTATVQVQNTTIPKLYFPYAVITSLTGGNTLLSQSTDVMHVAPNGYVTFTFHIQLAACNPFQLFFDVLATGPG